MLLYAWDRVQATIRIYASVYGAVRACDNELTRVVVCCSPSVSSALLIRRCRQVRQCRLRCHQVPSVSSALLIRRCRQVRQCRLRYRQVPSVSSALLIRRCCQVRQCRLRGHQVPSVSSALLIRRCRQVRQCRLLLLAMSTPPQPPRQPTRWGICSAGEVSHAFVVSLNTSLDRHQVVAVAARDQERCQEFADRYKIPVAYGAYEKLAEDQNVEIVYVGTLHTQHLRVGLMMLEAGKHLLVEKPCGMNGRELRQLLDKAEEKGLFFMEAIRTPFQPASSRLLKEVASGSIGGVKLIHVTMSCPSTHIPRLVEKELGGGCLIDIGIYALAFINMIFREKPESVTAKGHLNESGVDDTVAIILTYPGGRIATVNVCILTERCFHGRVMGTKGLIELPFPGSASELSISRAGGAPETFTFSDPTGPSHLPPAKPIIWYPTCTLDDLTGYIYEADAVREQLLEGKREHPDMSHADSKRLKDIMDEVRLQIGVHYDADKE